MTATILFENSGCLKASLHFEVMRTSGAQKNRLSVARLSSVARFSLETLVEEKMMEAFTRLLLNL